jgi:hypothetical protein
MWFEPVSDHQHPKRRPQRRRKRLRGVQEGRALSGARPYRIRPGRRLPSVRLPTKGSEAEERPYPHHLVLRWVQLTGGRSKPARDGLLKRLPTSGYGVCCAHLPGPSRRTEAGKVWGIRRPMADGCPFSRPGKNDPLRARRPASVGNVRCAPLQVCHGDSDVLREGESDGDEATWHGCSVARHDPCPQLLTLGTGLDT